MLTMQRAGNRGGRWLSSDPIGENGGLSLYGMVDGDPINNVDVLGLIVAPPVQYATNDTLNPSWAAAVTVSSITESIEEEPCLCGVKIKKVTVTVTSQVTIKRGNDWNQKGGIHGLTIGQHENRHVQIDRSTGRKLENKLKALIGKCRSPKCMNATTDYIDAVKEYYNYDNGYRNANYDVYDYPEGVEQRQRSQDANYYKQGRTSYKVIMNDAEKAMEKECGK